MLAPGRPVWRRYSVTHRSAAARSKAVPAGVIRHNNSLVATRLTDELLAKVQTTLKVRVVVGALCDNYDRLGSVNLALVPKGAQTYAPGEVDRIEIARFVTPFMDMNKQPKTVPYEWEASNLVPILKDPDLLAEHDFWFELGIFGVPYAANDEVPGCAGRNDTQLGSLMLYTDSTQEAQDFGVLLPLAIKSDAPLGRRGIVVARSWSSDLRSGRPGPCTPLIELDIRAAEASPVSK